MKEKLTLSIDKETKRRAKRHAKATGHSVSEIVERFLDTISEYSDFKPEPGSVTESLAGSMPLKDDRPYEEILIDELIKKYRTNEDTD